MRKINEKGVTLVMLITTVIVLLILCTVVIDIVIDDSIIESAEDVVNKSQEHENILNDVREEVRNQIS